MNTTNEAAIICAHLLRQGYLRKADYPHLELNEHLLTSVRDRLQDVGMELVINSYSSFYAVKLTRETQDTIEESNNLNLKNNEVAMLVILWSKLVLPKRATHDPSAVTKNEDEEENESEDDEIVLEDSKLNTSSDKEEPQTSEIKVKKKKKSKKSEKDNRIFVGLDELYAEFGKHFGSKTAFKATLTRLANLKFIYMHNEVIAEGIFLDLLIDGYQMGNEIKKSALAYKLAGIGDDVEEWDEFSDEEFLEEEDEYLDLSKELVVSETQIEQEPEE